MTNLIEISMSAYPKSELRDGPFDIQGGWYFFEKNSLFPNRGEKNKMSSTKLKIISSIGS